MVVDQSVRGSEGVKLPPDHYPPSEILAPLSPFLGCLHDMAVEYDAISEDGERTTAAEFIDWIAHDIERAAANRNLIHRGRNRTG